MSDIFMPGPQMVPGVDLASVGRDPNIPSKKEQMRMMALQVAANVVATIASSERGLDGITHDNIGRTISNTAEPMFKFLDG